MTMGQWWTPPSATAIRIASSTASMCADHEKRSRIDSAAAAPIAWRRAGLPTSSAIRAATFLLRLHENPVRPSSMIPSAAVSTFG